MTLMKYRATLTQYLIEQRREHPEATGEFNELLLAVAQLRHERKGDYLE